jgi:hypothetical protein
MIGQKPIVSLRASTLRPLRLRHRHTRTPPCCRRCFSSVDRPANGADSVIEDLARKDDEAELASTKQQQQVNPKALFPWRHETKDNPLPRLTPGTQESQYNVLLSPSSQVLIAHVCLGIPLWKAFLFDWRAELAEASSFAFTQGVAGIISNVYRLPFNELLRDNESDDVTTMDFDYKVPSATSEEKVDADESTASAKGSGPNAEEEDDGGPDVEYMLGLPLRKLYQAAHEHGRKQLSVRLQTTPVRAGFYSLFCLPFVSRRAAADDPSVLDQMRKMFFRTSRQADYAPGFSSMFEYVQSQVMLHDRLETTVELQVLLECEEIFQVVDVATGVVVQGTPIVGTEEVKPQRVWHLVTLEVTTTTTFSDTFPSPPSTNVGNWIITDIDDLLSPKKWYHK